MGSVLLTSCGLITEDIKNRFLGSISKDRDVARLKVSIITTGSPAKENNRYAQRAMQDFKDMGFRHIDFVDIEFDDPQILADRDVVYINGGNPFTLLDHARQSGADEVIRKLATQHVTMIGVSAGALLLGPNIKIVDWFTPQMNTIGLTDFTALGVIDQLIFPHYDREDLFQDGTDATIEQRITAFELKENCQVARLKE